MRIEPIEKPGAEWDAFVESMPGACVGHAAAWAQVLRNAYGLEACYLAARDRDGRIAGVLPLVAFRTLRAARELVSLPFLDAAGVLARDAGTERQLLEAALAHARERGARAIELRQLEPLRTRPAPDAHRVDLALPLPEDEETLWRALPGKVRNQTRKAEREGLSLCESDAALVEAFHGVYRRNMRDLGSPPHPQRFFEAARDAFGARLRIVVAVDGTRPVGGLVAIRFASAVTVPWASTLREERHRCPNNLIYWEALRWAVGEGARAFDFGRSPPGSGTHRFKRGWGAVERPLAWTRLDPDGVEMPARPPSDSRWGRAASRVWSALPTALSDQLGARVRGRISS